jgi:uncharacterized protein YndB with AHSA1/START domain
MSVKKEPSGRRSVQVEVEVPGTPEEVWEAIATGPGVSSWFVPTEVRDDGTVVSHFGPGMDAVATTTAWDPPRRFAAESKDLGPNAPPVATEWIVEARAGGTCVVRVVHSLFASSDDWDNQLEGFESGWPWFFGILRLYLTHFRGLPCSAFRVMGVAPEPASRAWEALTGSLGLAGAATGQRFSAGGVSPLAGLVERTGEGGDPHALLLRLDEPAPGLASLFAHTMGGSVFLVIDFYLYGDRAAGVVARDEPSWHAWMKERFPPVGDPSNVA